MDYSYEISPETISSAVAQNSLTEDVVIPNFTPLTALEMDGGIQTRSIPVPPNRYTPLRKQWMEICEPIVKHMKLQIRMNTQRRRVELRTCQDTETPAAIQKAEDFVKAFMLGFEIKDAIALLRLDDLYLDSFDIKDVKTLNGEHKSRAIGRVAGQGGKTKFTIENATRTRIVVADTKIHIMGAFEDIQIARHAIARLLRGTPPSKIYTQMRSVASRMKERY